MTHRQQHPTHSLTQHISWPHGNINGDHWAPPGNYIQGQHMDNTLDNLETTWHHLKTGWTTPRHHLEQHGDNLCQHQDNFEPNMRQLWDKVESTLRPLWDNCDKTLKQIWHNFKTSLRQLSPRVFKSHFGGISIPIKKPPKLKKKTPRL